MFNLFRGVYKNYCYMNVVFDPNFPIFFQKHTHTHKQMEQVSKYFQFWKELPHYVMSAVTKILFPKITEYKQKNHFNEFFKQYFVYLS